MRNSSTAKKCLWSPLCRRKRRRWYSSKSILQGPQRLQYKGHTRNRLRGKLRTLLLQSECGVFTKTVCFCSLIAELSKKTLCFYSQDAGFGKKPCVFTLRMVILGIKHCIFTVKSPFSTQNLVFLQSEWLLGAKNTVFYSHIAISGKSHRPRQDMLVTKIKTNQRKS